MNQTTFPFTITHIPASYDVKTVSSNQSFESNFRKLFTGSDSPLMKKGVNSSNDIDVDRLVDELIIENQEAMEDSRSPISYTNRKKSKRKEQRKNDLLAPVSSNLGEDETSFAQLEFNNRSKDNEDEEQNNQDPSNLSSIGDSKNPLVVINSAENSGPNEEITLGNADLKSPLINSQSAKITIREQAHASVNEKTSTQTKVNDYLSIKLPNIDLHRYSMLVKSQLHLQNLWVLSHMLTILGISFYLYGSLSQNSETEFYAYKVGTMGSALTYLIVLYRVNFEEQVVEFNENKNEVIVKTRIMTMTEFVKNENAQLLGFVILWNFTPMSIIKLAPFFIYSSLNLTSFFTLEIIPNYSFSTALLPLLTYLEAPMLITASHFDLISFAVVIKECYQLSNVYPFIIFSFIWLLRYESSEACRSSFSFIISFFSTFFNILDSFPKLFGKSRDEASMLGNHSKQRSTNIAEGRYTPEDAFNFDNTSSATLTGEAKT